MADKTQKFPECPYLLVPHAADKFKVPRRTITTLIKRGLLPAYASGTYSLVCSEDVDRVLADLKIPRHAPSRFAPSHVAAGAAVMARLNASMKSRYARFEPIRQADTNDLPVEGLYALDEVPRPDDPVVDWLADAGQQHTRLLMLPAKLLESAGGNDFRSKLLWKQAFKAMLYLSAPAGNAITHAILVGGKDEHIVIGAVAKDPQCRHVDEALRALPDAFQPVPFAQTSPLGFDISGDLEDDGFVLMRMTWERFVRRIERFSSVHRFDFEHVILPNPSVDPRNGIDLQSYGVEVAGGLPLGDGERSGIQLGARRSAVTNGGEGQDTLFLVDGDVLKAVCDSDQNNTGAQCNTGTLCKPGEKGCYPVASLGKNIDRHRLKPWDILFNSRNGTDCVIVPDEDWVTRAVPESNLIRIRLSNPDSRKARHLFDMMKCPPLTALDEAFREELRQVKEKFRRPDVKTVLHLHWRRLALGTRGRRLGLEAVKHMWLPDL